MSNGANGITLDPVKTDLPLALFPVRMETRFSADGAELRVRIYPDQVHVDTFEPELMDVEITWGKHFWEQTWLAGGNKARERAAWAQLAERFGPQRAAWIAKALAPNNVDQRTKAPPQFRDPFQPMVASMAGARESRFTEFEINAGQRFWERNWMAAGNETGEREAWAHLVEQVGAPRAQAIRDALTPLNPVDRPTARPEFPDLDTRKAAWTRAPRTSALPDRWIALGYVNGERKIAYQGKPIPDPLVVGPSPGKGVTAETFKDNPEVGWLVDFEKAVHAGMGLVIRYADYGLAPGTKLDRLLVLGVKAALPSDAVGDQDSGKKRLTDLFNAHHYTHGLAFVPQGTLSNNTAAAPSGYSSADPSFDASYCIERETASEPAEKSNRAVTAQALGIADSVFEHVRETAALEQIDAQHMNTVLWQATWGYFLELLMTGPGSPSDEAIRLGRNHFIDFVRARGPLPALRIGTQPYGVLPVMSFDPDHWKPLDDASIDKPLVHFLWQLREVWRPSLMYVPHLPSSDDIETTLQRILAMTPTAMSYVGRPAQRLAFLSDTAGPKAHQSGSQGSKSLAESLGLPWTPRQIKMVFASYQDAFQLAWPLVVPPKDEGGVSKYLQWLVDVLTDATRGYEKIWKEQLAPEPATLLNILLRHSILQEYAAAAFRVLGVTREDRKEQEGVNGQQSSPWPWGLLGRDVPPGVMPAIGVGAYLDKVKAELKACDYDLSKVRVQDDQGVPHDVPAAIANALREFASFFESLDYLTQQPATMLEALLRETLDLCSHRYDAWVTSFATKRLKQLREKQPQGTYLGGYGWVEDLLPGPPRVQVHPPNGSRTVLRVKTNGIRNGVYQTFGAAGSGPQTVMAAVYVRVVKGQVGIGTGNAGDTTIDASSVPSDDWQEIKAGNGRSPANEFVIYATGLDQSTVPEEQGYAEFYIAAPSVSDGTTNLLRNPEFKPRYTCTSSLSYEGESGGDSAAAEWHIWNNLKGRTETEILELPPDESKALFVSEGNQGYVHAPSLAHATTAAILRSGYASRCKTCDGNALAVNLSSERVRLAQWLLDGVRQGQTLGALLGYRFERGLHETHLGQLLDRYIPAFRKISPTPGSEQEQVNEEERLATQVADGLVLLRKWKAGEIRWEMGLPDPTTQKEDHDACVSELKNLEDAVDAINDLVIAESVHQVAQGKPVRAGATLDAIALGEAPPPDLEVIHTPRTGIGITHRIAVLFSSLPETPVWGPQTVRALAEPFLNAWAAELFGPLASRATCRVEYFHPARKDIPDRPVLDHRHVSIEQLELAPIDLLYMPESEVAAQRSELEQRVVYYALRPPPQGCRPDGVPVNADVRLTFVRGPSAPDWPAGVPGFAEILEAARTARRLVTGARALSARDLVLPEKSVSREADAEGEAEDSPLRLSRRTQTAIDAFQRADTALRETLWLGCELDLMSVATADDLPNQGRSRVVLALVGNSLHIRVFDANGQRIVDKAENALITGQTLTALKNQLNPLPDQSQLSQEREQNFIRDAALLAGDPEPARECLMRLAAFGMAGAVPLSPTEDTLTPEAREEALRTLRMQAESIERESAERVNRIHDLETDHAANPPPLPASIRDYHLSRLREVFGPEFRALPRFVPENAADLSPAFDASEALQDGDPLQSVTWFQRIARVREGAARLDAALLYAEALDAEAEKNARREFKVGQLPYADGDRWVGLPGTPLGGRLSLVVLAPPEIDPAKRLSGLLIDQWVETVPSETETTGVTYHFDAPQSRAPQSILLAVPPSNQAEWDLETLEATLLETLELAKLRAVDLTALAEAGQFLPALYFAHNRDGDTISTDLRMGG